jgi:ATP-dependent exoDNAse (exonuclease V) alpha subunit
VLFVGDVRQHVSVEAGDFLRVLETHSQLGKCEISEIHRQLDPNYNAAVTLMAQGDTKGGMEALDAMGWIHEGGSDYLQAAAADFLTASENGRKLDSVLAVCPTWDENYHLTKVIRQGLKQSGHLDAASVTVDVHESLRWTKQQKKRWKNYRPGQKVIFNRTVGSIKAGTTLAVSRVEAGKVWIQSPGAGNALLSLRSANAFDVCIPRTIDVVVGDQILIRQNCKRLGLANGDVVTINRIEEDGTLVTSTGTRIPPWFREWCHGYVVTSHKAQGRTCENVIVAANALDAKAAYVSCSRGRFSCHVYTPDKKRMLGNLPEGNRQTALDTITPGRVEIPKIPRVINFHHKHIAKKGIRV